MIEWVRKEGEWRARRTYEAGYAVGRVLFYVVPALTVVVVVMALGAKTRKLLWSWVRQVGQLILWLWGIAPIIIWFLSILIATGIMGKNWQEEHRWAMLFFLFLLFGLMVVLRIFAIQFGTLFYIWNRFTRKRFPPVPRTVSAPTQPREGRTYRLHSLWERFPPVSRTVSAPQFPSGPVEPPRGYQVRPLLNGGTEIAPPAEPRINWMTVLFFAVWTLFWTFGAVSCLFSHLGRPVFGTCESPGWVFDLAMLLIGLGVAYLVLHTVLLRHSWVAGPGWIARRTYVPLLRRFWDRVYSDLSGFEIRHGIWYTRRGSTDTLWLRTAGSSRKIRVDVQEDEAALLSRIKEETKLSVHPYVAAMGRFLANKTGTSLIEVTEEIPEPSTD